MNREGSIRAIFVVTTLLASALLFLVQPMCAKMVLPCLGGSPHVWTTSMLFFQGGLLLGYAYAFAGQRIGVRRAGVFYLVLIAAAVIVIWNWKGLGCSRDAVQSPVGWLLQTLTLSIGLPFVLLASASPMLQFYFAQHAPGRDPYSLYAASNTGSLLGLVGYPFAVERMLNLPRQSTMWSGGFVCFALLMLLVVCVTWSRLAFAGATAVASKSNAPTRAQGKTHIVRWSFLAFVPVSLMLSVTSHLSANLSATPVLWMVPLSIYLCTFILAFSDRLKNVPQPFWGRWFPAVVLAVLLTLLIEATEPLWLIISLHLLGLFWIAMLCHTELAHARPPVAQLTTFYLCIAAGGAIAGFFNAIVAPQIFQTVAEYPLMLAVAAFVRPATRRKKSEQHASGKVALLLDCLLPVALAVLAAGLAFVVRLMQLPAEPASNALVLGVPLIICYTFMARPARFALGIGALVLVAAFSPGAHGVVDAHFRSFFGVHRVTRDRDNSYRLLIHGNTEHGRQSLDPRRRTEPLAYYHPSGPVGDLFAFTTRAARRKVAVIGLGAGTLAAYAQAGEQWTFYEIDPAVVSLARDSGYFTYFADASRRGVDMRIVLGDGRLELAATRDIYALIVIDAFSSDTIPLHLATREALEIYRSHLTPDGVLGFHYSSRYLNLRPLLARLAASAEPPMSAWFRDDLVLSDVEKNAGKAASKWGIMTANSRTPDLVTRGRGTWTHASDPLGAPLWTDSSANLLDALMLFAD
jgi:hypothetical protein